MIARTWRGVVRAEDAGAYAAYIAETGLHAYAATPGNRGAYLLFRTEGERADIMTLSLWDSLESVEGFAGQPVERAVFYPEDDRFLLERDLQAKHWTVVEADASEEG